MARFVAFDVETPNRWNDRMSAIGITIVEDGEVVEEFYSLVDPEEPFDSFNVQLTGIDEQAVWGQPNFGELWPVIEPLMSIANTTSIPSTCISSRLICRCGRAKATTSNATAAKRKT